ncbi:MAG: V-type ATP synthase subunit I [Candidatus Diapherotrites archaeon]|nr:V-type ATP synthase subunit I [Candidatus Diapherotrites archaeon]
MFKPVRFKKFGVIVHLKDLEKVVSNLHAVPLAEIREVNVHERELEQFEPNAEARTLAYNITKLRRSLAILSQFRRKKDIIEQIKEFLFYREKPIIRIRGSREVKKLVSRLEPLCKEVEELDRKIKAINEQIKAIAEERQVLESISMLDVNLELLYGFERIEVIVGRAPRELAGSIEAELKASKAALLSRVEDEQVIFIASIEKQKADELTRRLRKLGFERIVPPSKKGKALELISELEGMERKFEAELLKLRNKGAKMLEKNEKLLLAALEALEIEKARQDALLAFGRTENVANFDAFVPVKYEKEFREILEKTTKGCFYIEELPFKEEEAPIALENPGFVKPYELIVKMYGMPSYNSFDPTPLIAIAFPIFFGLAFSDAGYGIMLLIFSIFMLKTLAKKSQAYEALSKILLHGSITTIIFGFMFGSFFGDLLGENIKKLALLDPLGSVQNGNSPMIIFMAGILALALVHLNIGIMLGFIEALKRRRYKLALTEKMPFLLVQAGALMLALNFSQVFYAVGLTLFALTAILLIAGSGPLGLMKITGFLGNTLSYLRLMALGLATFAIAMAINILARMLLALPYIGVVIMVLFLIFAHLANFIFNIISSFIHPLRLHCVEFFSYFFEGKGKEFKPFYAKRKYTLEVNR